MPATLATRFEYFVDAANGRDHYAGTADEPLATWAEFMRRAPRVVPSGERLIGRFRASATPYEIDGALMVAGNVRIIGEGPTPGDTRFVAGPNFS